MSRRPKPVCCLMLLSARRVEMNKETFRHVNYKRIWLSFCKIKEKMGNSAKKRKAFCKWFRTAEESPWFVNLERLLVSLASLQSAWREAWKSRGCMRMVLVIDQTQVLCWLDFASLPSSLISFSPLLDNSNTYWKQEWELNQDGGRKEM